MTKSLDEYGSGRMSVINELKIFIESEQTKLHKKKATAKDKFADAALSGAARELAKFKDLVKKKELRIKSFSK